MYGLHTLKINTNWILNMTLQMRLPTHNKEANIVTIKGHRFPFNVLINMSMEDVDGEGRGQISNM